MGPTFHISRAGRPWLVLFSAPTLDLVAEAVRAQPDRAAVEVYAVEDFARELTPAERSRLEELLAPAPAGGPDAT